jgi:hypothetical protein
MKKALIVWGGWDGHQPELVAGIYRELLEAQDFAVDVSNTLESFADADRLLEYDLIVPNWTMGQISKKYVHNVSRAVQAGVGLAGTHGGMCDAFRNNVDWQFMTGGNWVAHPGNDGVEYTVHIRHSSSSLLEGIEDFKVKSEQYYLHYDPAIEILATTRFPVVPGPHSPNGPVDMPVVWTKRWGAGRVFYCSLGHQANIIDMPPVRKILSRGFAWAAAGKALAPPDALSRVMAYTGMGDSE